MMKSGETSGHMRSGRSLVFQIAMGEQASPIAWSQRLPAQRVAWILPPSAGKDRGAKCSNRCGWNRVLRTRFGKPNQNPLLCRGIHP
ncbi:MAG: hypothetical protein KAS40_19050 [Desulfobacterales bacterium]|nr:hypothetical protein [Desulfobacterales bacterium]